MFAMDNLDKGPTHALDTSLGAMLIGTMFALLFQGTLMVQAFNYYENFPSDKLRTKVMVALVCMLDTAHIIAICTAVYGTVVTDWGYIPSLDTIPVEIGIHLMLTGLSCIVVQLYFLERIWVFSRKNLLVLLPLALIAVVPVVLEFHIGVLRILNRSAYSLQENRPEAAAMFVVGALSDLLIALVTCYYLRRRKSSFVQTQSVVARAVQLVVGSGLATGLVALGSSIAFFVRPNTLHFVAIHLQLGRTYTNALLATLNARKHMRDMLGDIMVSTRDFHVDGGFSSVARNSLRRSVPNGGNIVCMVSQYKESDREFDLEEIESKNKNELSR